MNRITQVREYWDARPCNIRHSAQPIGTRAYFDEVERRKYLVEPHIPAFADFARWRGARVLEVGCGIGTDTINFARAGARVTAVDLSQASIDIARARAEVFQVDDLIDFHCADIERPWGVIPQRDYDLIYSFGVLHHTPDPWHALENLHLFSGPRTRLRIMVYYKYSTKATWLALRYGNFQNSEAQPGCPVTHTFSRAEAHDWLLACGFETMRMWVDHIFPYRIGPYRHYRYVRKWRYRLMPHAFFHYLEQRLGWHLLIEARKR